MKLSRRSPAAVFVGLAIASPGALAAATQLQPAPGSPFAVGAAPTAMTTADFDGKGGPDIATAVDRSNHTVTTLLGDGAGTFALAPASSDSTPAKPTGLAAGDFDGDPLPDLAAISRDRSEIRVLKGEGNGAFAPSDLANMARGSQPAAVAVADLTGDGKQDVVTANAGASSLTLAAGTGGGRLAPAVSLPAGGATTDVAVGDFNGDTVPDLAAARTDGVALLTGDGTGAFSAPATVGTGGAPVSLEVADFDGDDDHDLAAAVPAIARAAIVLQGATGMAPVADPPPIPAGTTDIAAADFDDDSRTDVLAADPSAETVSVLQGAGQGTFAPAPSLATGPGVSRVAAADYDANGRPDVAALNASGAAVLVFLNGGDPATPTSTVVQGATQTPAGAVDQPVIAQRSRPVPVLGSAVVVEPQRGSVRVRLPGAKAFVDVREVRSIPNGTVVDLSTGQATVEAARNRQGDKDSASFRGGLFKVVQRGGPKPITDLSLTGPLRCGPAGRSGRGGRNQARTSKKGKARSLWGDGKGNFRTSGRYGTGTVRGTGWLVQDRCNGTYIRTSHGLVNAYDKVLRKTVRLPAGRSYLARAPRR